MGKLKGYDVLFQLVGETIALSTGCDIETNTDFIEVCSPVSGADREYIPTTFGWGISANYLCTTLADAARLIALQRANTRFDVRIFDRALSTVLTGHCYIKSLRLTANKGNLAKFSATYQPTGGLEQVKYEQVAVDWGYGDIADVDFDKSINHALKKLQGADMRVMVFEMPRKGRVKIEATDIQYGGIASLIPLPEDQEENILDIVEGCDNLRFFNMEIAHLGDRALGFEQELDMMMKPGRYAFLVEGHADMTLSVRALYSLPATT